MYLRPDFRPTTYSVTSRPPMIRLRPGVRSRPRTTRLTSPCAHMVRTAGVPGLSVICCGSPPPGREGARGAGPGRRLEPCALLPLASRRP